MGFGVRLVLENSTACTLSNANLYLGIHRFACPRRGWVWWVLGFFEIEMDNNRQIDLYLLVSIKLAAVHLFRCLWCFSFTESLILAQDERWRRA